MINSLVRSVLANVALLAPLHQAAELDQAYAGEKKLLLSVEVSRHGERQPGYMYDLALNPEEEFKLPFNLTETGAQSHYASGKGIREFFDKQNGGAGFLSKDYDEKEIYIQTTYLDRTIDSARSQLDGLYGKPLAWPEVDPEFNLNIVPQMEDFIVHIKDDDCERFA